ncbi:MAG TPA: OmcA/MtrC family decaheme c-type cytochrome [Acidobacteriota bacterium]|nr:OmcA/MtrC family decaheme c-type cytochrome [Acidobacteriota bacterium]
MRRNRIATMLLFTAVAATLLSAATLDRLQYSKFDLRHYLTSEQVAFVHPGLNLEVQDVILGEEGIVQVEFTVSDDRGLPLDLEGVFTPGEISARFILARIPAGLNRYEAYTTRVQTSPITNVSAVQPSADSGGTFERLEDGRYLYTYGTRLPADFDPDVTHTVAIYSERDLTDFGLGEPVDNDLFHFVPSGAPVETVREIALTTDCNDCHDPLALHGGVRREVGLCITCHYDGVIDPDTGNSVDMRVMIHKIHRGEDLPSVQAGEPYEIIGFGQRPHNYSEVVFPQDVRNCTTCHGADAMQSQAHLLRPTRAACGACHDDVNFMTGEGHAGGPVMTDNFCANCHFPEGEFEFDASIIGAHTIPNKSNQLAGINITIDEVMGTGPGENPTVIFRSTDDEGNIQAPSEFAFYNLILTGPTEDYTFFASEGVAGAAEPFGDAFSYTFEAAIPDDAEGTFAVGAEAFRNVVLNEGLTNEMSVRETAENPVFFFGVTDVEPVMRRMAVDDAKCESCHEDLALHGTIRHNATDYCQMCHRPDADDSPFRAEEDFPPRSIDFKFMIHRIHMGEELTRDFTVIGFGGSAHNYNSVLYPGDLRNCTTCHVNEAYQVPSQGIEPTIAPREFFSPMPPNTAACVGCHDSQVTAAHAFVNIAPFAESCATCHREGAEFAVSRVHARAEN